MRIQYNIVIKIRSAKLGQAFHDGVLAHNHWAGFALANALLQVQQHIGNYFFFFFFLLLLRSPQNIPIKTNNSFSK